MLGVPVQEVEFDQLVRTNVRRPVPSGGAFYPAELYLALPSALCHYDPVHHELEVVGGRRAAVALFAGLGMPAGDGPLLILTCRVWKNCSKYGAFGYRLGCLDLGVVVGQSLALTPAPTKLFYCFADRKIAECLYLDLELETPYAVLRLSNGWIELRPERLRERSDEACGLEADRLSAPKVELGLRQLHWSALSGPLSSPPVPQLSHTGQADDMVALPEAPSSRLVGARLPRRSALGFARGPITSSDLARVLQAMLVGYSSDVDGVSPWLRHIAAYCAVVSVTGLDPGVYRYVPASHSLVACDAVQPVPHLRSLAGAQYLPCTAASIFPVGSYETGMSVVGDRWYRIQNMEAGLSVMRCYQAAAAAGLGCRVSLASTTTACSTRGCASTRTARSPSSPARSSWGRESAPRSRRSPPTNSTSI
jgi:SagB-type dehydrogenase family enzyme